MRGQILGILGLMIAMTGAVPAEVFKSWTFDQWNNNEGWKVTDRLTGVVTGGSLWLTLTPKTTDPTQLAQVTFQVHGDASRGGEFAGPKPCIESPTGLSVDANRATKVRIQLINLSGETDGWVFWRVAGQDNFAGPVRFTMQPDLKEWQEVVCHIDKAWQGTIDQLRIQTGHQFMRGDQWIKEISITDGPPRVWPERPDVCSEKVVPRIQIPGIAQATFADAFKVLDECLVMDVPLFGFDHPYMAPGGAYGSNWWQLDTSLNLAGAKWVNQAFAEGVIRGFASVQSQNPDGRIDLWGGGSVRGQTAVSSSCPRLFETAYDVARRSGDPAFQELVYTVMKRYLDWWLSPTKRDPQVGLVTATFEETIGDPEITPGVNATVDTNVAVAIGCWNVAFLAERLGKKDEAVTYHEAFENLKQVINTHLWDEERGQYRNLNLKTGKLSDVLVCTTFDPLRLEITPPERRKRLLTLLHDPAQFNWGSRCLTSIAKTDPKFVEAKGPYDGSAWYGDIWTMRNLPVIAGLRDIEHYDLAAELAWSTIKTFHGKFTEYITPTEGSGEGVQRYGWSASQYIEAVVDHVFGVDADRMENRLRILPLIPKELRGQELRLEGLILPFKGEPRLNLVVKSQPDSQGEVQYSIVGGETKFDIQILFPKVDGELLTTCRVNGEKVGENSTDYSVNQYYRVNGIPNASGQGTVTFRHEEEGK